MDAFNKAADETFRVIPMERKRKRKPMVKSLNTWDVATRCFPPHYAIGMNDRVEFLQPWHPFSAFRILCFE